MASARSGKKGRGESTWRSSLPGMESNVFDVGSPKDAAIFQETKRALENYVRREVKSGAKDIAKAIANGEEPDLKPRKLLSEEEVKGMSQLH